MGIRNAPDRRAARSFAVLMPTEGEASAAADMLRMRRLMQGCPLRLLGVLGDRHASIAFDALVVVAFERAHAA